MHGGSPYTPRLTRLTRMNFRLSVDDSCANSVTLRHPIRFS